MVAGVPNGGPGPGSIKRSPQRKVPLIIDMKETPKREQHERTRLVPREKASRDKICNRNESRELNFTNLPAGF